MDNHFKNMYYLVKTKVETEDKPVSEQWLVSAESIVEAEAKMTQHYDDEKVREFETTGIQESKILGVI